MKLILIIATLSVVISKIQIIHAEEPDSRYSDLVAMYKDREGAAGIEGKDTSAKVILKLSMGNRSAYTVLVEYLARVNKIDPGIPYPSTYMLWFDTLGIHGKSIWILYHHVCRDSIACTHAFLRSVQLGILPKEKLYFAIENREAMLDIEDLYAALQARLKEGFHPPPVQVPGSGYFGGYHAYVIGGIVAAGIYYFCRRSRGQYLRAKER